MTPFVLEADDAQSLIAHARREWPREACGLLLRHPDGGRVIYPAENLTGRLHREDPQQWRPATEGFVVDPKAFAAALHWIERGFSFEAIYHSHPNGQTDLSQDDRAMAIQAVRTPALAHTTFLVVALRERHASSTLSAWAWDGEGIVVRPLVIQG